MLAKILSPSYLTPVNSLQIRFNMAISWKKIKEKMFEREKYYKDYEMAPGSLRVDHEKYKIYIASRSLEIVRTDESTYRILSNDHNFTLTFLQNLDFMKGKQFTWSNRKNISVSFRDILQMQTVSKNNPITIQSEHYSLYNTEQSRTLKELKIQVIQDGENGEMLKLSLLIVSQSDSQKWLGVFEMNWDDYIFLVQSAKKNIYYCSGLKTTIELQKREIVRMMDKRVINNQEKQLKSSIEYDLDQKNLLDQMEDNEQIKPKPKKKAKSPQSQ